MIDRLKRSARAGAFTQRERDQLLDRIRARLADGPQPSGEIHHDLTGPAVYWLGDGTPWTAVLCEPCHHLALLPSIPLRSTTWRCPNGHLYPIDPPIAVLSAAHAPA